MHIWWPKGDRQLPHIAFLGFSRCGAFLAYDSLGLADLGYRETDQWPSRYSTGSKNSGETTFSENPRTYLGTI